MAFKETRRKGFNFFRSYYDVFNELDSDADKLEFIEALLDKQFLGKNPEDLRGMVRFAYISQVNSIDSQVKGYETKTQTKLTLSTPPSQGVALPPAEQVKEEGKEEGKGEGEGVSPMSMDLHTLRNELLANESWKESVIRNIKNRYKKGGLLPMDKINTKILEFVIHLESEGETVKDYKDGQSHFKRWIGRQIEALA